MIPAVMWSLVFQLIRVAISVISFIIHPCILIDAGQLLFMCLF